MKRRFFYIIYYVLYHILCYILNMYLHLFLQKAKLENVAPKEDYSDKNANTEKTSKVS